MTRDFILKIVCVFLFLFSFNSISQTKNFEVTKYKKIGLVWGLLKYHHSEVSKGKYDWDVEFVTLCNLAEEIQSEERLNELLYIFANKYKNKSEEKKRKNNSEKIFLKNSDYSWINNENFGNELTTLLLSIKDNENVSDYYASINKISKQLYFANEKGFKEFDYKIKSHRLLLLNNFWNMTQYWNVNKYLMDVKWLDHLDLFTEEFINCESKLEFEIIKSKLISKLNDSHSFYCSHTVNDSLYKFKPVFNTININDSLVVNYIYNKKLAEKDNIEIGDVIYKINNKSIKSNLDEKLLPLLSVSNSTFLRRWSNWLFFNNLDTLNIDIIKKSNSQRTNKIIHLYNDFKDEQAESMLNTINNKWALIKPDIGYVNLSQITNAELSIVFKEFSNTKGIIVDLRNYPKNISNEDIAKYLYPEKKNFIKVLFPIKNKPSIGEFGGNSVLYKLVNPFYAGGKNQNYYKGRVILLVNRTTQSNAEFIGMTIQQAPTCITIGEQTAGSVMNVVKFIMTDMTSINFTGLGAFYPDGQNVQRDGLKIDYYIKGSAIKYDTKLYIDEAIKLIEKNN